MIILSDAEDGLSGVEIELALNDDESGTQDGEIGGEQTETEEPQRPAATTQAAPVQSKASSGTLLDFLLTTD